MQVYLDSNVFISAINQEIGFLFRPLFREAEDFFDKVKQDNHVLVLSKLFFKEVSDTIYFTEQDVIDYFTGKEVLFEIIASNSKGDLHLMPANTHKTDWLHFKTALNFKCDCIVSFNTKHFEFAKNDIKILEPNDFIEYYFL